MINKNIGLKKVVNIVNQANRIKGLIQVIEIVETNVKMININALNQDRDHVQHLIKKYKLT
jgi:hypothetical protein